MAYALFFTFSPECLMFRKPHSFQNWGKEQSHCRGRNGNIIVFGFLVVIYSDLICATVDNVIHPLFLSLWWALMHKRMQIRPTTLGIDN